MKQKPSERIKPFMNWLETYLEVLDIELDSADVKSILYHALLPKYCDVFESKFENFNLNETPWHSLEEYGFQAESFHSFANASSGSGGSRKCYYCGKHGHIRSNCPSWRLKSPSEKTSSERVPSEKRVPYEKQTLLQEGKCFNCRKTGHMMRDCPEKKSMIDLGGGNSLVDLSNYLEEKSDYDLFLSKAELASEKFDGSIPICPPPDDTKVYIPVTWGQEKSLDVWMIFDPVMTISCCDYNLWEGLEGEVGIGKTSMMGIGGKSFNLMKFKWVYGYTLTYQARIKIWRNVMLGGNRIVLN